MPSVISGVGHYLPDRVVTNAELAAALDNQITPEAIERITGIRERRFVLQAGIGASGLGKRAAERALASAGRHAREVDCVVFTTLSPDMFYPGSGVLLTAQLELGEPYIPAFDLRNQCASFIYALSVADAFIRAGSFRQVLVVSAELHSNGLQLNERGRDTAMLFGDGAGAVLLEADSRSESGILAIRTHSDGTYASAICWQSPGSRLLPAVDAATVDAGLACPYLDGPLTFKWARRRLAEGVHEILGAAGLKLDDVDWFLFHQANGRILQRVIRDMNLPEEKCPSNIERVGNLSSASIPVLLDEQVSSGRIRRGDIVILSAFGAGYNWGAAALRW